VFDAVETLPVSSNLPDAAYPGVDALKSLGVARCELTLKSQWVKDGGKLKLTTLVPTETAWRKDKNDNAERRIYCVASKKDGSRLDGTISAKKDN
jgi:eukaryotic-like serine/threonine-protein kinase